MDSIREHYVSLPNWVTIAFLVLKVNKNATAVVHITLEKPISWALLSSLLQSEAKLLVLPAWIVLACLVLLQAGDELGQQPINSRAALLPVNKKEKGSSITSFLIFISGVAASIFSPPHHAYSIGRVPFLKTFIWHDSRPLHSGPNGHF